MYLGVYNNIAFLSPFLSGLENEDYSLTCSLSFQWCSWRRCSHFTL